MHKNPYATIVVVVVGPRKWLLNLSAVYLQPKEAQVCRAIKIARTNEGMQLNGCHFCVFVKKWAMSVVRVDNKNVILESKSTTGIQLTSAIVLSQMKVVEWLRALFDRE